MSSLEPGGPAAWEAFIARHGVGDQVDGEVTKVLTFGAFVRLAEGVDGLLVGEDRPGLGARVPVRIAEIDLDKRRMKLVAP